MDRVGRLLVVEVKPARSTTGIAWAPAQVGINADLFQQWVTQDIGHAVDVLTHMLAQRIHLGLSPDRGTPLQNPPRLIPMIIIGGQVRSKVALDRLAQLQQALVAQGVGQPALQLWTLDAAGQLRLLVQPH